MSLSWQSSSRHIIIENIVVLIKDFYFSLPCNLNVVGVRKAREIAGHFQLPIVGVHHMEAHTLVARYWSNYGSPPSFPKQKMKKDVKNSQRKF